jgi:formylglycine-generating enzyme required for sulfatase activity/energy-coupling factor transporter ATP-binding protein EcfA2
MSEPSIQTGGAAIQGDVQAGRDFVGRDQITINITWQTTPFKLEQAPDLARLRADYLAYLRDAYQYLDFKGLPQVEKIAQQLPLDAIYVPLHARPEMPEGETWLRVAGRLWKGEEPPEVATPEEGRALPAGPLLADQALGQALALVILGDPGAGKSTLLKVLALALARQPEGPLPILVPLNAYAAALEQGELSLHDFLVRYFATRQHCLKNLGPLFDAALQAGQAVVLLDGLDEVQANRPFLARLVQDFAAEYVPEPESGGAPVPGSRLVVTSRIVGYREAPLAGTRWRTYTLADFGREEIERFVERWTLAFESAVHGDSQLAGQAARRERDELLLAISGSPGIERLASNPLLLTILALIKRQGVSLPQRRVELYELYLRTLINAWNKARSLDQRPVGPDMDYLETVQVLAPLGLWLRETNPTAGLVSRAALEDWLSGYYIREWEMAPGPARRQARDFLKAVHRYSNLLVERGADQYGFLHLTFEEMLAAKGIAAQAQLGPAGAVKTILRHLDDPNWRETILLAVGALGVVAQQPLAAGEVLRHLCQAELADKAARQNVVIAGEALLDVGEVGVGRRAAVQVTAGLVETMQHAQVSPPARRQAGLILGRLGWQPEDLDAFVEIAPGPFLYGEKKERRQVSLRFWMGKYPVTNAQYARFIEAGGYLRRELWSDQGWAWRTGDYDSQVTESWLQDWLKNRPPEKRERPFWWDDARRNNPIFPVVGVSWFEAEAYGNWLAEQLRATGFVLQAWCGGQLVTRNPQSEATAVRLPTEAEWERAARGADGREYPWGDAFDTGRANTWESKIENTTAICTYPQGVSPEGVWDAAGNVWEWTASRAEGVRRVLRGGSWGHRQRGARCAVRGWSFPDLFDVDVGFRLVVSLALPSSES